MVNNAEQSFCFDSGMNTSLVDWLRSEALPWWATQGVDWIEGGFFERFNHDGRVINEPRRARVVARQIYVFATAAQLKLCPDSGKIVDHGLDFLLSRMQKTDGTFVSSVSSEKDLEQSPFCLYEHAFVIFCFAKAYGLDPVKYACLKPLAVKLLETMRRGWSHPSIGFEEAQPRSLPLQSNPHMHLFEAAIAWIGQDPSCDSPWFALAEELCSLCLAKFIDPTSGAIRELFDGEWQAYSAECGQLIEPGHQFEWAWLFVNWSQISGNSNAIDFARRLINCGETYGVDPVRNVAINSLSPALTPLDQSAKLWPQTERLKAWCAALSVAETATEAEVARRKVAQAQTGLQQYLFGHVKGLWQEVLRSDGTWSCEPTRASSLYHIVCSCETLIRCKCHFSHGEGVGACLCK